MASSLCLVGPAATSLFYPGRGKAFGGSELQLYLLATALARDPGFRIAFLLEDRGQPKEEIREGVRLRTWARPPAWAPGKIRGWPGTAWRLSALLGQEDWEVCGCRSVGATVGFLAAYARRKKKRFVYMVANDGECDGTARRHLSWGTARAFFWGMRHADLVIAQSHWQEEALRARGLPRVVVVPSLIPPPPAPVPAGPGSPALWVGRAHSMKNAEGFLRLCREFSRDPFAMILAPGQDSASTRRLWEEAGRVPNLKLLPGVSYQESAAHYRDSAFLVSTSPSEGFPNTFLQAWGAARAVVSITVNPDGILTRFRCGLVAENLEGMAAHIKTLRENPGLAEEMGRNGYEYVVKHHHPDVVLPRYRELYRLGG